MRVRGNELLLIFDSEIFEDRKALGYAKSLQYHKVKERDIRKEPLTETQVQEVIEALGIAPEDMIDKSSDIYENEYANVSLDRNGILTAISKNPQLMKTPIAIREHNAKILGTSYEFIQQDMDNDTSSSGM